VHARINALDGRTVDCLEAEKARLQLELSKIALKSKKARLQREISKLTLSVLIRSTSLVNLTASAYSTLTWRYEVRVLDGLYFSPVCDGGEATFHLMWHGLPIIALSGARTSTGPWPRSSIGRRRNRR
jgi:hypothetical protein